MNKLRRTFLAAAAAVLAITGANGAHSQEPYPRHPIKLVVAFAAGTGGDALARIVGTSMSQTLGQPIVIDNRAGAGGVVGTEQGARAPADGYTLTLGTTSTLLTNPALNPNVRYHAEKDFTALAGLARTAFVVVTANTPEAPKNLAELVDRLKAKPGAFGSAGVGTVTHLVTELLLKRAEVKATHVPYRGSSQSLTDVAAGQLDFASDSLVAALPLIRGGRLRALAVTSAERLPALPGVPTVLESGIADFKVTAWWGLVGPAGLSADVVKKTSDAAMKALASPEVKTQLAGLELEAMPLPAAGFRSLIHTELPVWTDFVRQTGIRVEF